MFITKLDIYIIRKFLGTFFFIFILLMSISMVFDIAAKLTDFLGRDASWFDIFTIYYSNFIIYYGFQFIYMINFISVIWFTSKLAQNTEIVPILSTGASFNRFLRPYFISATLLVALTILMYNFVLPPSNKARLEFEELYYRTHFSAITGKRQVNLGEMVSFGSYNTQTQVIRNLVVEQWKGDSLSSKLVSDVAIGDSIGNMWELSFYNVRIIGERNDQYYTGGKIDTLLNFNLSDLIYRDNIIEAMNFSELNEFIEQEKQKNSDRIPHYLIEKYNRFAAPFAIYILTLIGVSVSSRKSRGGIGINIAIGLGICVLYIFSMKITNVAALNIGFPPLAAVWLPNIIFAIIAAWLYKIAPK
jgi:lipopolysaccharide export system permease protein